MSGYNPELFKPRPSEALVKLTQDTLDELGHYPELKKQLEETLKGSPPSIIPPADPHHLY